MNRSYGVSRACAAHLWERTLCATAACLPASSLIRRAQGALPQQECILLPVVGCPFGSHYQRQLAIRKASSQLRSFADALRGTHDLALVIEQDRVTALHRGQRAHGMQRTAGLPQGQLLALQSTFHRMAQALR